MQPRSSRGRGGEGNLVRSLLVQFYHREIEKNAKNGEEAGKIGEQHGKWQPKEAEIVEEK